MTLKHKLIAAICRIFDAWAVLTGKGTVERHHHRERQKFNPDAPRVPADARLGEVLTHPVHGPCRIVSIDRKWYEEMIPDEGFVIGQKVTAEFDHFIPAVHWRAKRPDGTTVSRLIFHSWYLQAFKR